MLKPLKFFVAACLLVLSLSFTNSAVFAQEFLPIESSKAIVKIYTYRDDQEFFLFQQSFGSGVIIDPSGLILTNFHVIGHYDEPVGHGLTAYRICLTLSPEKAPSCNYVGRVVAVDIKKDIALLRIIPQADFSNKNTFPSLKLDYTSPLVIGNGVLAMGYPDIGGETITISQGKIIGKETLSDQTWLKTDAVFSLGSSGGALLNAEGKMIGMTTAVKSDVNTLGYVMDVSQLKPWIEENKNNEPNNDLHFHRLVRLMKEQATLNSSENVKINFGALELTLVRPNNWLSQHVIESRYNFFDTQDSDGGEVAISFFRSPYKLGKKSLITFLKGEAALLKIKKMKKVILNGTPAYLISLLNQGVFSKFYYIPTENYLIKIDTYDGKADKAKDTVARIIASIRVKLDSDKPVHQRNMRHNLFTLDLFPQNAREWFLLEFNDNTEKIADLYNIEYPDSVFRINARDLDVAPYLKNADNKALLKEFTEYYKKASNIAGLVGVTGKVMESDADYKIKDRSFIHLKVVEKIDKKFADYVSIYATRREDSLFVGAFSTFNKNKKVLSDTNKAFVNLLENFVTVEK